MKKTTLLITSAMSMLLVISCASNPAESEAADSKNKTNSAPVVIEVIQESPEMLFLKSLEGISITKVSSPKEVTKGKSFAAPFVFAAAKADGSPAEGLSLTISYPASKSEGKINYEKAEAVTDAEGKISFEAAQTSFAAAAKVSVYPTPVTEDKELAEELKKYTAEADWKVKSDLASKGAVLFVWDYNERDRPVNNSYNIQAEFRGRGITMVGNGPIGETSYIGKPKSLYKDTYDIIGGTAYGYLIYGTIKFEQPVTALEDGSGYYCILKAEIEAVTMKNGELVYSSSITHEETGKNWNDCVSKAKDKLSKLVVDDIIYGL